MTQKFLWKKKEEHISNVESKTACYLFRNDNFIMLNIYSKRSNEPDEEQYLFTEREANEILGNTFYMFERIEADV